MAASKVLALDRLAARLAHRQHGCRSARGAALAISAGDRDRVAFALADQEGVEEHLDSAEHDAVARPIQIDEAALVAMMPDRWTLGSSCTVSKAHDFELDLEDKVAVRKAFWRYSPALVQPKLDGSRPFGCERGGRIDDGYRDDWHGPL